MHRLSKERERRKERTMRAEIQTALLILTGAVVRSEFNFEVGWRVHERVSTFMGTPLVVIRQLEGFRANGALTMAAHDRDAFLRLNYATMTAFPQFDGIYYGLEDGTFAGHFRGQWFEREIAWYREPGHSGYTPDDPAMEKYYLACVNPVGESVPCRMARGDKYTQCNASAAKAEGGAAPLHDCLLERCADEVSQTDCESDDWADLAECQKRIKWCSSYVIKEATDDMTLAYVPRSAHCTNSAGVPTQTQGEVVIDDHNERGNCYYEDGETLVERQLEGDFAYCGGDGEVCNDTFVGALFSSNYDPRWRGWYIGTKRKQKPNYSPPYPFFSKLELGITYSIPIYTTQNEWNVFAGVLAVDYTFKDVSNFLQDSFKNSEFTVVIFEQAEPNYIVASSTGSSTSKLVLGDDESKPCPADPQAKEAKELCSVVRVKVSEYPNDDVTKAFFSQRAEGFPETELVATKTTDDNIICATQSKPFSIEDAGLDWTIMIMIPVETLPQDTLMSGDVLFTAVVLLAGFGFLFCSALVGLLVRHRTEREVMYIDWRFTSAFVGGAALLNASCLSFLGENSDALCLTRMWLIHFFFVFTLSFLFVKTYRLWKLVGSGLTRATISHAQTARMTLPLIGLQTLILLVFTFVDPYKRTEIITTEGSLITHQFVCAHNTPAFSIVMAIYEGGLIIVGCILAYKTRNLRDEFNESKQIILAMYNTALICSIGLVVANTAVSSQGAKRMICALGILCTSCFTSLVFVFPRLLQVRSRRLSGRSSDSRVRVSGVNLNKINGAQSYTGYNKGEADVANAGDSNRADGNRAAQETVYENIPHKEKAETNNHDEPAVAGEDLGEETLTTIASGGAQTFRRRASMEKV